jgi:hypothetical protein
VTSESGDGAAEVRAYIDAVDPAVRALFERLHRIVLSCRPDAEVGLSYRMPGYRVGSRRLNLGAWKHGVSVYGWRKDNDGGFVSRHPELASGKATIRLGLRDGAAISDHEFSDLLGDALEG